MLSAPWRASGARRVAADFELIRFESFIAHSFSFGCEYPNGSVFSFAHTKLLSVAFVMARGVPK